MQANIASRLRNQGLPAWLLIGARLLLLAEGLGQWGLIAYFGPAAIYGLVNVVGPALFLGIPALAIAVKPRLNLHGRWMSLFLVANTVGVAIDVGTATSKPDPYLVFAALAAVSLGASMLIVMVAYKAPRPALWLGLGGILLSLAYSGTYALPPTAPPAPALHLEGVLSAPPYTHSVRSINGGNDVINRLRFTDGQPFETARPFGTVNPGRYQIGQACPSTNELTWSIVDVSVGATVTAADLCPLYGTLQGSVSRQQCGGPPETSCQRAKPYAGQDLDLLLDTSHFVHRITTDASGHYEVKLWPGTYQVEQRLLGSLVAAGPTSVTVLSRSTTEADFLLRP